MKINFDRLSKLAGLPGGRTSGSRMLRENSWDSVEEQDELPFDPNEITEQDMGFDPFGEEDASMMFEEDEEEGDKEADPENEVVEIDEVMLVQELRRMKNIMNENRRRQALNESARRNRAKQNLYEAELKRVIDEEVQSVMREMNLTGDWVYGQNKPTRSKNGYSHHGSYLKGIGFR